LWTYLSLLGALAALIVAADIVIKFVFHGADVPGCPSLMVAIVFFGSAQFISLGVIGEYLGRLYIEVQAASAVRRASASAAKSLPGRGERDLGDWHGGLDSLSSRAAVHCEST
jgi:hypothetical protein